MFKLSCLVFQVQRLESLCLVSASTRPSFFIPVKEGVVPCAAYLSRSCGILRPFYFDDAGGGDELSLSTDSSHTLLWPGVYPPRSVENTTYILGKRRISLHPFTCFVFQVEYYGTKPKAICWHFWAFHYSTLSSLTLAVEKYYFFSLLWTWREVVYTAYELFLELL